MAAGKPANMRILIVEDDTALAGFVRKGLEAEHYAVDVSSDGNRRERWLPNWITT
jgi:DNA-binding response OmpR family regulator